MGLSHFVTAERIRDRFNVWDQSVRLSHFVTAESTRDRFNVWGQSVRLSHFVTVERIRDMFNVWGQSVRRQQEQVTFHVHQVLACFLRYAFSCASFPHPSVCTLCACQSRSTCVGDIAYRNGDWTHPSCISLRRDIWSIPATSSIFNHTTVCYPTFCLWLVSSILWIFAYQIW